MKLNIVQFRKQIREALDAVERGEEVYITRHNKTFAIIKAPFNYLTTTKESSNIRPTHIGIDYAIGKDKSVETPEKKSPGATPQLLTPPEHPCCEKQKPCKHWQYDDVRQVWVNSVSGRERGVE